MLIKRPDSVLPSEITAPTLYTRRREFLRLSIGTGLGLAVGSLLPSVARAGEKLAAVTRSPLSAMEKPTPLEDISSYGNFVEFGYDKQDAMAAAQRLRVRPWEVRIEGLVQKPKTLAIDDILRLAPLEERIYRHRCVEGWSMVIPWVGFPLATLLKQVEPLGNARYVELITITQADTMLNMRSRQVSFPYVEGLRLDEAMHPLTLAAVGMYGEALPKPNGAPLRLVVPWKYGFKSAKSINLIRFTDREPRTFWSKEVPDEYGFYANVNPDVDHPRWSQARERRIGEFFKRKTLPFNGYADQVASLYAGMDLKKYY
jgi:methionine sulfoxide reductase catalytic subunit